MDTFFQWWQHLPQNIDPILLQLGAIQIRYYGLMYLTSFLVFYFLTQYRLRHEKGHLSVDAFDGFLTWAILGIVIGARLGYVFFYHFEHFLSNPVEIFWPVQTINGQTFFGLSGLSYHGGLVGAIVVTVWFCKNRKTDLWKFMDLIIPAVPLGYMFGRIGNFLNNELYGRVTTSNWGMYFPHTTYELRHPSQLYEAFFEGLVLFVILWSVREKLFKGALLPLYLIGYGIVRFAIEFVREPDEHIGFVVIGLSMGQVLCLAMVVGGVGLFLWRKSYAKVA